MRLDFRVPDQCRDCTFVQFCQTVQSETIDQTAATNSVAVDRAAGHNGLLDKLGGHEEAEELRQTYTANNAMIAAETAVRIQDRLEDVVEACSAGPRRRFILLGAKLCQSTAILEVEGLNKLYPWLLDKRSPKR